MAVPTLLQSLEIEEAQSRQIDRDSARCQLPLREQFRLVFADVLRTQAVRGSFEVSGKIFNCIDVTVYGILGIITTLEFLQHHFSQMGHRDLLVTQTYLSH